jgi:ABC-type ATPase with predicted acetyltransferase domain
VIVMAMMTRRPISEAEIASVRNVRRPHATLIGDYKCRQHFEQRSQPVHIWECGECGECGSPKNTQPGCNFCVVSL